MKPHAVEACAQDIVCISTARGKCLYRSVIFRSKTRTSQTSCSPFNKTGRQPLMGFIGAYRQNQCNVFDLPVPIPTWPTNKVPQSSFYHVTPRWISNVVIQGLLMIKGVIKYLRLSYAASPPCYLRLLTPVLHAHLTNIYAVVPRFFIPKTQDTDAGRERERCFMCPVSQDVVFIPSQKQSQVERALPLSRSEPWQGRNPSRFVHPQHCRAFPNLVGRM